MDQRRSAVDYVCCAILVLSKILVHLIPHISISDCGQALLQIM